MAKFIEVTQKADGGIIQRAIVNIDKIRDVQYAGSEEARTRISFCSETVGNSGGIENIYQTPGEIHELIEAAQGSGDLDELVDEALREMLADKSPDEILQMMKDGAREK